MKKILGVLLTIVTIGSTTLTAEASGDTFGGVVGGFDSMIYQASFEIPDESYQAARKANEPVYGQTSLVDYSVLVINENNSCSAEEVQYIYQFLDDIPAPVLNSLMSNGWKIVITSRNISGDSNELTMYNIAGYCDLTHKRIDVTSRWGLELFGYTLTHEIGHYVSFNMIYDDVKYIQPTDFTNVYFHYGKNTYSTHYSSDEGLAQAFVEYIYYPVELATEFPQLYSAFDKIKKMD